MLTLLGTLALTLVAGCPFRKERITVMRDGRVRMQLEYESPSENFEGFDALPSADDGWSLARRVEKEDKPDEKRYTIEADRTFAPDEPLPQNLASPGDRDADLALQFPTTLTIDDRADGTYYTFRRVYTPRRWAYVQHWYDTFVDDQVKKLGEKKVEELTRDEKEQIVQALAAAEAFKQIEFTDQALNACGAGLKPETGLLARRAMLSLYENEFDHFSAVLDACEPLDKDAQDQCFEQEVNAILEQGYDTYVQSLVDSGLSRAQFACFEHALDRESRYYENTKKLGGNGFEIDVEMPGTIVAHNAEKEHTDRNDRITHLTWQFDGTAFRDRSFEMLAVSRVDRDAPARDTGSDENERR
jgi:hypothetical protein